MGEGEFFVRVPEAADLERLDSMGEDELRAAYQALVFRAQLAEMALFKLVGTLEDSEIELEKGYARRGTDTSSGKAMRGMFARVVRDYVDPILPMVREAIGYTGPGGGWYLPLEGARAKIVAAPRAARRLREEGRMPEGWSE